MFDIVVVMDERTSSRAGDKEASLQGLGRKEKGTQFMDKRGKNILAVILSSCVIAPYTTAFFVSTLGKLSISRIK